MYSHDPLSSYLARYATIVRVKGAEVDSEQHDVLRAAVSDVYGDFTAIYKQRGVKGVSESTTSTSLAITNCPFYMVRSENLCSTKL